MSKKSTAVLPRIMTIELEVLTDAPTERVESAFKTMFVKDQLHADPGFMFKVQQVRTNVIQATKPTAAKRTKTK